VVLSTVVPGVVLLGIVIFVHELGHFLAAKWRGVTVLKFSLGMGPELVGFRSGGTRYCLSWIPLGGFVQMAGDSPNDDGSLPEGGQEQFLTHHWFGRVLIAVAGPLANLVTAYVVVVGMCLHGLKQPDYPNVVGPLPATSPAWAAGFREGDRVLEVSGRPVSTWHALDDAATARDRSRPLALTLERSGQRLALEVPADRSATVLGDLDHESSAPVVGSVVTGMPAYRAGVKEKDRIVAVDGRAVSRFEEIGQSLQGKVDRPVKLDLLRDGRPLQLSVTPINPEAGSGRVLAVIGIEAPRGMTWVQHFTPRQAVVEGLHGTAGLISSVYASMWLTVSRPLYYRDYVGGPIFIGQMARDSARKGIDNFLYLLAMINIAIMAFNLLPVPLLDGGHITLALLEAARRRSLSARAYINFQKVGLVLVGTLFVFIISKDIVRPFQRMRALDRAPRETTTVAPAPH
jgi:regulator of sigma E protease